MKRYTPLEDVAYLIYSLNFLFDLWSTGMFSSSIMLHQHAPAFLSPSTVARDRCNNDDYD